jgi:hypothetical protein
MFLLLMIWSKKSSTKLSSSSNKLKILSASIATFHKRKMLFREELSVDPDFQIYPLFPCRTWTFGMDICQKTENSNATSRKVSKPGEDTVLNASE